MNPPGKLLQIVPRLPDQRDAVGEYANTLAQKLRARIGHETIFTTGEIDTADLPAVDDVIVHYVNYGYQRRGVPRRLLSILQASRALCAGKFITVFHELYASAPPWRSAFWLRPLQIRIARAVAQFSHQCIVPNDIAEGELQRLAPRAHISVHPVFSNFGEPLLSPEQIANRDSHHWAICGGTAAIVRALRSFSAQRQAIPAAFAPSHLDIVGGSESRELQELIVDLAPMRVSYRPNISAPEASAILSQCSFAWFDYFHRAPAPGPVLLKSSAFAAACAHAIVPVFPHAISAIAQDLPKPLTVDRLGDSIERASLARRYYSWYQKRASSDCLTSAFVAMLT